MAAGTQQRWGHGGGRKAASRGVVLGLRARAQQLLIPLGAGGRKEGWPQLTSSPPSA